MRPIILLDVDDVLNWCERRGHNPPYCGCDRHCGWVRSRVSTGTGRSLAVHLDPAHGPAMLRLASEGAGDLAWFTSWEDEANRLIGPLLGLPGLPVVPFPPWPGEQAARPKFGGWKGECLVRWALGDGALRPFLLFDNEPDIPAHVAAADLSWPHKIITVDPHEGLTGDDLAEGAEWLAGLPRPACQHCSLPREGLGVIRGVRVCHTDRPGRADCYRRITVYREMTGALRLVRPVPAGVADIVK